jgi:hypothetical protein
LAENWEMISWRPFQDPHRKPLFHWPSSAPIPWLNLIIISQFLWFIMIHERIIPVLHERLIRQSGSSHGRKMPLCITSTIFLAIHK